MAIFDTPEEAAEYVYIQEMVPAEAQDLWQRTVDESPYWEGMDSQQHMDAADMFAEALFSGSLSTAEEFLDMLGVEWDDVDIGDFYDLYELYAH